MVNPVNLQLSHWNLEHTAQQLKDPAAAAVRAGMQGEGAVAAVRRDSSVQPADQSAEEERVGVRKKKEKEERDGRKKKRGFSAGTGEKEAEDKSASEAGGVDFYA